MRSAPCSWCPPDRPRHECHICGPDLTRLVSDTWREIAHLALCQLALGLYCRLIELDEATEGRWPGPDDRCRDCTDGTTPDALSPRPCAIHAYERMIVTLHG